MRDYSDWFQTVPLTRRNAPATPFGSLLNHLEARLIDHHLDGSAQIHPGARRSPLAWVLQFSFIYLFIYLFILFIYLFILFIYLFFIIIIIIF